MQLGLHNKDIQLLVDEELLVEKLDQTTGLCYYSVATDLFDRLMGEVID